MANMLTLTSDLMIEVGWTHGSLAWQPFFLRKSWPQAPIGKLIGFLKTMEQFHSLPTPEFAR